MCSVNKIIRIKENIKISFLGIVQKIFIGLLYLYRTNYLKSFKLIQTKQPSLTHIFVDQG